MSAVYRVLSGGREIFYNSLHKASRVVMVVEPLWLAPGHGRAEVQKTHNYNCPLDKAVRSPHNARLGSSFTPTLYHVGIPQWDPGCLFTRPGYRGYEQYWVQ